MRMTCYGGVTGQNRLYAYSAYPIYQEAFGHTWLEHCHYSIKLLA